MKDELKACENTDRKIWSEYNGYGQECYITANPDGGIGICVGGSVIVKSVEQWHSLASAVEDEPKDCGFTLATCPYERCAGITMRKPVEVEPLAELADRKGVSVEITPPSFYQTEGEEWNIDIAVPWEGMLYPFDAPTYAECEAKARKFLAGLPDRPTKGAE